MGIRELDPGMGVAVAERTILRKDDNGNYESWGDVSKRVAYGNAMLTRTLAGTSHNLESLENHEESERNILTELFSKGALISSGRHLQHGDENQINKRQTMFTNCSSSITSFGLLYLALNGSGIGRLYDDEIMVVNWDHAPNLVCVIDESHADYDFSAHTSKREAMHRYGNGRDILWHEVGDSREGWAKALELYESAAFEKVHVDKMLILDFSKVRPKGSPIAGMQDRPASGPVPLMNAFRKVSEIKGGNLPRWRQAMIVDHFMGECVVVGGVRRIARLAGKSWKDKSVIDFINIKRPIEFLGKKPEDIENMRSEGYYSSFLWTANNSVFVDQEFWDLLDIKRGTEEYRSEDAKHARGVFKALTAAAYADGTGEPGIVNVDRLNRNTDGMKELVKDGDYFQTMSPEGYQLNDSTHLYLRKLGKKAVKMQYPWILNPCYARGTRVPIVDEGLVPIENLVGRKVRVIDGDSFEPVEVEFRQTGDDVPVMAVSTMTERGEQTHMVTPYHRFVLDNNEFIEARYLEPGMTLKKSKNLREICGIQDPKICPKVTRVDWDIDARSDVFCCTVPGSEKFCMPGYVSGNCGEIVLSVFGGFCVIADTCPFHCDTLDEAEELMRATTRFLIRVNLMDSVLHKEVQRTNRIGVGITGIHEFAWKFFKLGFKDLIDESKSADFWETIRRFNKIVREESVRYANELGVAVPHTSLTIKPAGCVVSETEIKLANGSAISLSEIFAQNNIDINSDDVCSGWYDIANPIQVLDAENNPQDITRLYVNGKFPTIDITFEDGYVFKCTCNHKLLTSNRGWVRADLLQEGDDIVAYD